MFSTLRQQFTPSLLSQVLQHVQLLVELLGSPADASFADLCDCVSTGRVIRMLTMVDDYTRECPIIEVDTSLGDRGGVAFMIQGTTSSPKFVPDVGSIAGNAARGAIQKTVSGKTGGKTGLGGILGKRKPN